MRDYSFLLKLEKYFPFYIKRLPDIEKIDTQADKGLYRVSYYIKGARSPFKISFNSKDGSFSKLYSITFYDKRVQPCGSLVFDNGLPFEKFFEFIKGLYKYADPKNSALSVKESELDFASEKFLFLDNFMYDIISKNIENIRSSDIDTSIRGLLEGRPEISGLSLNENYDSAPNKIIAFITLGIYVLMLVGMVYYYVTRVRNKAQEFSSAYFMEKEINDSLFSGQKKDEPAFYIYKEIIEYIQLVIDKKLKALILCGPPGMSKTYIVRRTLHFSGKRPLFEYNIAKGSTIGVAELYGLLYEYRDKILVLDDFDTPLRNEDMVNLIKGITDSYARRVISLPRDLEISSGQAGSTSSYYPEKFAFNGQVIIITNLPKSEIPKPLLSRAPTIEVNFDTKKVIEHIKKMMEFMHPKIPMDIKEEVFNVMVDMYKKDPNMKVDFRRYMTAVEIRYCLPKKDFDEMVKIIFDYSK